MEKESHTTKENNKESTQATHEVQGLREAGPGRNPRDCLQRSPFCMSSLFNTLPKASLGQGSDDASQGNFPQKATRQILQVPPNQYRDSGNDTVPLMRLNMVKNVNKYKPNSGVKFVAWYSTFARCMAFDGINEEEQKNPGGGPVSNEH